MGLGSDKETGKSPFVTAQRFNCGSKLSFLLSFLTLPVEWNYLCRWCRALLKCGWGTAHIPRLMMAAQAPSGTHGGDEMILDTADVHIHVWACTQLSDAGTHPFWKRESSWKFTWGKAYYTSLFTQQNDYKKILWTKRGFSSGLKTVKNLFLSWQRF